MIIYVGIDPGVSGCITLLQKDGTWIAEQRLDQTEKDISDFLYKTMYSKDEEDYTFKVVLEKVHSMPSQGVSSTFKFGKNYGFIRGCLFAFEYAFEEILPNKWQTKMECKKTSKAMTKTQHKNLKKAKAQQLFPSIKITHRNSDSTLLAEYARRFIR